MTSETKRPAGIDMAFDAVPEPRGIPFDEPWQWLASGWRDMLRVPHISLTYGAVFSLAAAALVVGLWIIEIRSIFLVLAGGFLLIGPLLAVDLYEASRRIGRGETVRLSDVIGAGLRARGQLAFFGAALLFAFFLWLQLALLLLMLFVGTSGLPPPDEIIRLVLFTPRVLGMVVVGTLVGGVIAVSIFAISVVSVPMLLVSRVDAASAARASLAAVAKNPKPLVLWAALIVAIVALGFAMLLVGLVIAIPLIGHATWHAYAAIYGTPD